MSTPAIRLVCLDVDGTLLGASDELHPLVSDALAAARDAGIRLAICSGRPGFGVTEALARRVEPGGWHSFQNGASVIHFAGGGTLSEPLPAETVRMLVERARADGRILELYTDRTYAVESRAERAARHAGLLGLPFTPRPFESLDAPVVRAQWLLAHDAADVVLREPHPGLEVMPSLAPSMPDTLFVNMTRAGVNKGTAVRAIASRYGIPLSEVMYVGDGFNDTPAMALVGLPVAMSNAEPEPQALALVTVGHVDDGGAAEALQLALDPSTLRA